jgi:hypothetical protein
MQVRVAETRDAEGIVAVINAAFRLAESFLLDRDRIDLQTVQGQSFLPRAAGGRSAAPEIWPWFPVDECRRSALRESRQQLHGFANRKRPERVTHLLPTARVR